MSASVWRHLPVFRSYLYVRVQFGDSGEKKGSLRLMSVTLSHLFVI